MLSEKPWRAEVVMLLGAGLLLSLSLGGLLLEGLKHWLPATEPEERFYRFLISAISFQGVGLLLLHFFLKQHGVSWGDFVGWTAPQLRRALKLALLIGVMVVPACLVLNKLAAWVITLLHQPPEVQPAMQVLREAASLPQRVCFGLAAIVFAPVIEESLFRGILYPWIKQKGYPGLALAGSSILFAAIHYNLMTFLPLVFLAVVLVWLYERTDTLLAPILTHALFNAVNFSMFFLAGP